MTGRPRSRLLLLLVLLLLPVASAAALLAPGVLAAPPSPVVIPPPRIPLAFSHPAHTKLGVKCSACHPAALKSIDAGDNLLPKEAICVTCHRLDAPDPARAFPKSTCETCHPGFKGTRETRNDPRAAKPAPVTLPAPRLRMTHRSHTLLGIVCTDCHGNMERQTSPSRGGWSESIPSMGKCLECHNGNAAPSQCTTCHLTGDDGRIVKVWPEGNLAPSGRYRDDDHRDPAWNYRHAAAARDEAYCASCHAQNECLDCHAGVDKPQDIHPGNWILLHARDAMTRPADCFGCHEGGVGCQKCHETTGVTQSAAVEGGRATTHKVHPRGWADFAVGPDHHANAAISSIDSCVSCHTEQECIRCHSSRTLRVNPHPPGFNGSFLRNRNDAVCRKCHDTIP